MEAIKKIVASWVRKAVFAGGSVWLTKLIEAGVVTEGDIDRGIEIGIAIAMIVIPALWTPVKAWIMKKIEKA